MTTTFCKLMTLAILTITMVVAASAHAAAQTTTNTPRGRVVASVIVVVGSKGDALQRNGNNWKALDADAAKEVTSSLQQAIAERRVTAQATTTTNDEIALSGKIVRAEHDVDGVDELTQLAVSR